MRLSEGPASTDDLLSDTNASTSAIYDALSSLRRRGLLSEGDDTWGLTAYGQLVADAIDRWQSTETFLERDPEYWKHHDATVIPSKFRRRLPEIGEYEVIRSDRSQVTRHHRAVVSRLQGADHCLVLAPFFSVEYQAAVPNSPETRMLIHPSAVDTRAQRIREGLDEGEYLNRTEQRLTECEFGFTVGDGFLVFSLPTRSDDPTTATVVSETDAAVEWARELFEEKWDASESIERYAAREHPDIWG
jgi:predicted transcriptional regulator